MPMSDESPPPPGAAATLRATVLDDDDLLSEILVRLPPRPSPLALASFVCNRWLRLLTDPGFLRRFRVHHRNPPILGVFEKQGRYALFRPLLDAPDRIPPERFSLRVPDEFLVWNLLGCRHGLVLIMSRTDTEVIVFDPISRDRHRIVAPDDFIGTFNTNGASGLNGAVLCAAAAGDDHGPSSPFKVVLVETSTRDHARAIARVYSSETGVWGNLISTEEPCAGYVSPLPSTLIGNALYWWLHMSEDGILEFDLDSQSLAVVKRPPVANISSGRSRIIRAEEGGLGFAVLSWPSFQTWHRNVDCHGVAAWVLHKTVQMDRILGLEPTIAIGMTPIVGYSEEAHIILISVCDDVFMVDLEAMQSREFHGMFLENSYCPFATFSCSGTVSARNAAPAIEPPK